MLSRGLYLDSEGSNCSDDVERVSKDLVLREHRIKLPDSHHSLHMSHLHDDAHKVCNSKVHDMCETRKAMLLGAETVNAIGKKCHLDVVACCVIVASVVRSHTEKLSKYTSYELRCGYVKIAQTCLWITRIKYTCPLA